MPLYKEERHVGEKLHDLNIRLTGVSFTAHVVDSNTKEYNIKMFKKSKLGTEQELKFLRVYGHDNAYRALDMLHKLLCLTDEYINLEEE
jgi:hypothetical protein